MTYSNKNELMINFFFASFPRLKSVVSSMMAYTSKQEVKSMARFALFIIYKLLHSDVESKKRKEKKMCPLGRSFSNQISITYQKRCKWGRWSWGVFKCLLWILISWNLTLITSKWRWKGLWMTWLYSLHSLLMVWSLL